MALVGLLLAGCGSPAYRNYGVPESLVAETAAARDGEVRLNATNSRLAAGGIRVVTPEAAAPAPAFDFVDENGIRFTNESLRGQVVWVDLWADYCATCRAEFPRVQQTYERYRDDGFVVLGLCRNSSRAGFEQAAHKDWIDFPMIDASDDGDFPFPYAAFPTSILLDREGRVRSYWRGHRAAYAVDAVIERLLREPGALIASPGAPIASPAVPLTSSGATIDLTKQSTPLGQSVEVVRAAIELEQRNVAPGGRFAGHVVLEVEPGWHLSASTAPGAFPLSIDLGDTAGVPDFRPQLPPSERHSLAGESIPVHSGRIEIAISGSVSRHWPAGHRLPLRLVATVQACDESLCLAPSRIVLSEELRVESLATP